MISGMRVGPILMQLDLLSVEEVPFHYVRTSFCPENVGNWSASPRNDLGFSPRSVQTELFPASPGVQLQELHRQRVFDPTGSNTITIVHRIEKNVFFIRSGIVIVFDPVGSKTC